MWDSAHTCAIMESHISLHGPACYFRQVHLIVPVGWLWYHCNWISLNPEDLFRGNDHPSIYAQDHPSMYQMWNSTHTYTTWNMNCSILWLLFYMSVFCTCACISVHLCSKLWFLCLSWFSYFFNVLDVKNEGFFKFCASSTVCTGYPSCSNFLFPFLILM